MAVVRPLLSLGEGGTVVRNFTVRFWCEAAAFSTSTVLFGVTLVWPTWIELMFHADPDHGSGRLEWLILLASLMASLWTSVLARREWRRMHRQPVTGSGQA
jgi:hypothetical protein